MKISFLGTNGWYADAMGNTMCTLLETKDAYIILDAGDGIQHLDKYLKKDKPAFLFLSHMHIDHVAGLHILGKINFKKGLFIYCPKSTKKHLKTIFNHPFTAMPRELHYQVEINELKEGIHDFNLFQVECRKLMHIDLTFGYRVMAEKKVVTYLCDTGGCSNANLLARSADVLIHESAMKAGETAGYWGHSNPNEAAMVAKNAEVEKLILTHFAPNNYPTKALRKKAQSIAKKIFKNTISAEDGLRFIV
jgi:ribonuclease BN (tRNA processing enzyme)